MEEETEPLKLVLKCRDPNEFGDLYALNKPITDKQKEELEGYMRKYRLQDYENIMVIEGNPQGWMCQEKDVQKVEEILNITETVEKQKIQQKARQEKIDQKRRIKDQAMTEIEKTFQGAPRPSKFLKKLIKKADIVYDPGDSYLTEHERGEGQLFIIEKNYIWYIINNGRDEDDYALNNIKTTGPGAVGFRLPYDEDLHTLIKIFTDENLYKGK